MNMGLKPPKCKKISCFFGLGACDTSLNIHEAVCQCIISEQTLVT